MKTINIFRLALGISFFTLVFACSKNSGSSGSNSTITSQLQTQADDQAMVSNESDAVTTDANTAMYGSTAIAGNSISGSGDVTTNGFGTSGGSNNNLGGLICDATVTVQDTLGVRSVTINYNGSNCWGNRTRTGVVVISIPTGVYWKDAGAQVTLSIQNLKITRVRDNKSIVINGSKTLTNVSGGRLADLATLGGITHTITGNLVVTFDNGSQRSWNVSKQRVYSYSNGVVITTTGTHTDSLGNSDVAEWGTNRFGVEFESLISQPKVIRQDCDFRLVSGQNQVLRSDNITTTVTYGLDANGDVTTCPGSGTYYFKVVRVNAGGLSFTKILPY